jgi:transcriptional regulator with XRE-family HTH domain
MPVAMMLERETFGPVLRAARERQGISLEELADVTKVGIELWRDLEENDLSKWPGRVYARTYVRQYATHLGLDAEFISSEFCRLFPEHADRRAEGLLRNYAAIVQHQLDWEDEPSPNSRNQKRRSTDVPLDASFFVRRLDRILAVVVDLGVPVAITSSLTLLDLPFWVTIGVVIAAYHSIGVMLFGRTIGCWAGERGVRLLSTLRGSRHLISSRVEP